MISAAILPSGPPPVLSPPDPLSPASPASAPGAPPTTAAANLKAAFCLLVGLQRCGLRHVVVCPGSRSAPLAVAAAVLEPTGLRLHTALDERSAAFFALGLGRAEGCPTAVVTTSGSAVAQLLPACVEADYGAIPLLLLSADRPDRLKRCGANQSVNQESFLQGSCRWFAQAAGAGLASLASDQLEALAQEAFARCLGRLGGLPAGPVHLNLPFEAPLHGAGADLAALVSELGTPVEVEPAAPALAPPADGPVLSVGHSRLDPDRPGVVVAGPWRGSPSSWSAHRKALIQWQRRSGWPVLADPLSGLRGCRDLAVVAGYDLLLEDPAPELAAPQVLRLGSLPASRRLEGWLAGLAADQLLVSEGDPRRLDPLGVVVDQVSHGLQAWVQPDLASGSPSPLSLQLAIAWQEAEAALQRRLDQELGSAAAPMAAWSEPALARQLSRLLPEGLPLMLANSSPVRDWESFADPAASTQPVFGFRGASGIDGTLSEACGLAEALGACLLLTGDLALLHDANGWLWRPQLRGQLTVVVIDNDGGGIFEQLPIRTEPAGALDFERLFAMPQPVDLLALAALHGVPARRVETPEALSGDLAWALAQPFSLLVVPTDRRRDADLRRRLRTMAATECAP